MFFCFVPMATATIVLEKSNTVSINSAIDEASVAQASSELQKLCNDHKKDIYLVLYSPGGSVTDGSMFIDFVKALPCKVHTIPLFAASMAYQITQSLGTRYVIPSSILMSHRASLSGISGQLPGELLSRISFYSDMIIELEAKTAKRLGMSLKEYQALIYDELWLTAYKALKGNHADKLEKVRCGKSLMGTKTALYSLGFFGSVEVTVSKCPLIIGPLEISNPEAKDEANKHFNYLNSDTKYEYTY